MINKSSSKSYWDEYYQQKTVDQIPWSGVNPNFFNDVWDKYHLPQTGNILDVGCGRGDKAIFLAEKGYSVWGFDVSDKAIEFAKKASENMVNKPIFFQSSATELNTIGEIKDVRFDIILDKLVSQFLTTEEKNKYLDVLKDNLKKEKTFYILQCFGKDKLSSEQFSNLPDWIKKAAMTLKQIKEIYGEHFSVLGGDQRVGMDGREVDMFVMKSV